MSVVASASAQESQSVQERRRILQIQNRPAAERERKFELKKAPDKDFDFGGWYTHSFLDLKDDDHQRRTADSTRHLTLRDARFYAAGEATRRTKYYLRARYQDYDVRVSPGSTQPDLRQQEGLEVDQAIAHITMSPRTEARLGRQFVQVGRGLSLAADLDAGQVEFSNPRWQHRVFAGRSLDRDPGIDTSIVGYDQGYADHFFYGFESRTRTPQGNEVYAYALHHQDNTISLDVNQRNADFQYQSRYFGVGSTGNFHALLAYYIEAIWEDGTTLAQLPGNPRVEVTGNAFVSGMQYFPKSKWRPQFNAELAMGSGDADRLSVTNAFGGKQSPRRDRNFLYYGAYDGGLALSPRLSNLVVARVGAQVKPLPRKFELPELSVGTVVSRYWKDERTGAISDTLASAPSSDVGVAVDAFVGFRPTSDLSVFAQFGRFDPGEAYPVGTRDGAERLLLTGTQSF